MKSEFELIEELKDTFETNYNIASNILVAGSPNSVNVTFYSRQKDWCFKHLTRFQKVYEDLKSEKLDHRLIRALGDEENIQRINKCISTLEKHRDDIIKRKEQEAIEAEAKRKALEEAKKKDEEAKERLQAMKMESLDMKEESKKRGRYKCARAGSVAST